MISMRPYSSKSIGLRKFFRPWQSMAAKLHFVMRRCPRPMRIKLRLLTPGIHPPHRPHRQPTIHVRSAAAVAMTLPLPVMGCMQKVPYLWGSRGAHWQMYVPCAASEHIALLRPAGYKIAYASLLKHANNYQSGKPSDTSSVRDRGSTPRPQLRRFLALLICTTSSHILTSLPNPRGTISPQHLSLAAP